MLTRGAALLARRYDDRHMFLAPFTPGRANTVRVDLGRTERVAAVRLWNYAKTSSRGVRAFEITIDGSLVYQGTARPAPLRQGNAVAAVRDGGQRTIKNHQEPSRADLPLDRGGPSTAAFLGSCA